MKKIKFIDVVAVIVWLAFIAGCPLAIIASM